MLWWWFDFAHGNILAQYLVNKLNCATLERATLKVSVVSIDFLLLSDLEKIPQIIRPKYVMYLLISMFLFKRGWLLTKSFFFKFSGCQVCPNYILVFLTDSMYSLFRKPAKLLLKYNAAHIWGFAEIRQSVKRNIVVATELLIMYVHLVATMLPS